MVEPDQALPGRARREFAVPAEHPLLQAPLEGPFPADVEVVYVAMGCFWGAERAMWQVPGVFTTAVGYQGGYTPHANYNEVCTGKTGHTEAVLVAYRPGALDAVLKAFWERHDPTQGMRQGNDTGTQYRSAIYWTTAVQGEAVLASAERYREKLTAAGKGAVTTELRPASEAGEFYYAEPDHQQYLFHVPDGYCSMRGTGVEC
ncbi:peptide-methionine (S)-S-oxide reductase MsrA [Micrococcales bacterium 31B]|nr:peptide-methionine (S)-S-oxide reductase MsrA [Micrococcales bacterium 31B]